MDIFRSKKTLMVSLIALFVLAAATIMGVDIARERSKQDLVKKHSYYFEDTAGCIKAYKKVPIQIVNKLKEYVVEKGYFGEDITFEITNSYSEKDSNDFSYYIEQKYKGIDTSGYLKLSLDGEVVKKYDLKKPENLGGVQTDNFMRRKDALKIATEYLGLKESDSSGEWRRIYHKKKKKDYVTIYEFRFCDQTKAIYINAATGDILKTVEGKKVKRDDRHFSLDED